MMICPSWHFNKNLPNEYELVFEDLDVSSSGFYYATGYRSANLRDILNAIWYLNGAAYCVELTKRQQLLLEDVRVVSQRKLAAFRESGVNELH